jgi:hypothetical protein
MPPETEFHLHFEMPFGTTRTAGVAFGVDPGKECCVEKTPEIVPSKIVVGVLMLTILLLYGSVGIKFLKIAGIFSSSPEICCW